MNTALIGLDGLAPSDTWMFDGDWHDLQIETIAHTAPSWNAIFTGKERDDLYGFNKVPDEYEAGEGSLADQSDERWSYEELSGDYLWEEVDAEVISAPVVLPTYSSLPNEPPNSVTWPTVYDEVEESIDYFKHEIPRHDNVIAVLPLPDKINHFLDNPDKHYLPGHHEMHMRDLSRLVNYIKGEFDRWLFMSDHGKPSPRETFLDGLWTASHDPTGVISSNAVDVEGYTNTNIYPKLVELFNE